VRAAISHVYIALLDIMKYKIGQRKGTIQKSSLKGPGHQKNNFFKASEIKSVFPGVHFQKDLKVSGCFVKEKHNNNSVCFFEFRKAH
jgi:hypothetical protein